MRILLGILLLFASGVSALPFVFMLNEQIDPMPGRRPTHDVFGRPLSSLEDCMSSIVLDTLLLIAATVLLARRRRTA